MSIEFVSINEYKETPNINLEPNTLVILGQRIDERSGILIEYLKKFNSTIIEVVYQNKSDSYLVNNSKLKINALKESIYKFFTESSSRNILLECTSLGYVEILAVMNILNNLGITLNIKLLYAEPIDYKKTESGFLSEDYELSEEYNNPKYLKPFIFKEPHDTISNQSATLITLIGFEEERLGRILEENKYDKKFDAFISLVAIPGFQFGWENISLSRHNHLLNNNNTELFYTPADNPYETYKTLEKITENLHPKRIIVVPIGTKPCAIGACIFLVNKKKKTIDNNLMDQVAAKYDFPIKSIDRTFGISKIYEYVLRT